MTACPPKIITEPLCDWEGNIRAFEYGVTSKLCADDLSANFYIALDLEGVDLGRDPGTLEIISVCIDEQTFVIDSRVLQLALDLGGKDGSICVGESFRRLVTDKRCITVMHDCRRDCDALWHYLHFLPANVHDTSAAYHVIYGIENANLNVTLAKFNQPINKRRGKIDYISYPRYWEQRPLTKGMVMYAAGDVHALVPMAHVQLDLAVSLNRLQRLYTESKCYRDKLWHLNCKWISCKFPIGEFVGYRGFNIKQVEKQTCCAFYSSGTEQEKQDGFYVYYAAKNLASAHRALGHIDIY